MSADNQHHSFTNTSLVVVLEIAHSFNLVLMQNQQKKGERISFYGTTMADRQVHHPFPKSTSYFRRESHQTWWTES